MLLRTINEYDTGLRDEKEKSLTAPVILGMLVAEARSCATFGGNFEPCRMPGPLPTGETSTPTPIRIIQKRLKEYTALVMAICAPMVCTPDDKLQLAAKAPELLEVAIQRLEEESDPTSWRRRAAGKLRQELLPKLQELKAQLPEVPQIDKALQSGGMGGRG